MLARITPRIASRESEPRIAVAPGWITGALGAGASAGATSTGAGGGAAGSSGPAAITGGPALGGGGGALVISPQPLAAIHATVHAARATLLLRIAVMRPPRSRRVKPRAPTR